MQNNKKVDISIIVPCRNEGRYITGLVERILAQKGAGNLFTFELLLVNGQSEDNTVAAIQEAAKGVENVRILENPARITPTAFNIGIKASSGQYICILGAHSRIAHDYIYTALRTIREIGSDNVGGPWRAVGEGYWGRAIALAFQSSFSCGGARSHNLNYRGLVDSVWGGFYKREVFDTIGYFDENLVRNQDDELNFRLVMAGGKIFQTPDIKYEYVCRATINSLWQQYFQYGYFKAYVLRKHHRPAAVRHLVPSAFVLIVLVLGVATLFSADAFRIFLFVSAVYLALLVWFSVYICLRLNRAVYLIAMPLVFAVFHFSYGLGLLWGALKLGFTKEKYGRQN